jgi:hypothetical protein
MASTGVPNRERAYACIEHRFASYGKQQMAAISIIDARHTVRLTYVLQRRGGRRSTNAFGPARDRPSQPPTDFTSSARNEIIHACLLRMLHALANLLLTWSRDQVSDT